MKGRARGNKKPHEFKRMDGDLAILSDGGKKHLMEQLEESGWSIPRQERV